MIEDPGQEGTSQVKRSGSGARVKVSADGKGVVSHAGAALLRELAAETGLAGAVTGALMDTYRGVPLHMPGQVFTDLAVAIADGADAVTGIEVLRDRQALFGPVASMPTAWRLLDRVDEPHLERVRAARAAARDRAGLLLLPESAKSPHYGSSSDLQALQVVSASLGLMDEPTPLVSCER
jgi:Transposase DDE domain group 1